ncbi:MAG TPA: hypothetical protein VEI02_03600, partial [Planctomycetota bacterium]|nr:hypothetical protein [Planctomycetota bacterium]
PFRITRLVAEPAGAFVVEPVDDVARDVQVVHVALAAGARKGLHRARLTATVDHPASRTATAALLAIAR